MLATANTGKIGRGFGKNAGEWTGRVEISLYKRTSTISSTNLFLTIVKNRIGSSKTGTHFKGMCLYLVNLVILCSFLVLIDEPLKLLEGIGGGGNSMSGVFYVFSLCL